MPRDLTLNIPDDLYEALVRIAGQTRQTPEELAEAWFAAGVRSFDEDPLLKLAGCVEANPAADRPGPTEPPAGRLHPDAGVAEGTQVGPGD
jgi:hypothetical protein